MMQNPTIRHSFVQINGSCIHLMQYSRKNSINSNLSASLTLKATTSNLSCKRQQPSKAKSNEDQSRKIIIFVPGNPGCLGVYHDFIVSLFQTLDCSMSAESENDPQYEPIILAIGHNNFDHPEEVDYKAEERICIGENEMNFVDQAIAKKHLNDPNHIELQVLNKLVILKRILKLESCKIIFIGHSIGGYVILKLLQDREINNAHLGTVLIHPALENLALTAKGSIIARIFNYRIHLLLQPVAFFLQFLPKQAKLTITRWLCSSEFVNRSSQMAFESVAQLVCRRSLNALIEMAQSELAAVKNINADSMIKPHVPRLKLIYAINDHWVNTDNRRLLGELYPELHIEEQDRMHAFVMDPQTAMDYAIKVGLFVQDFVNSCHTTKVSHSGMSIALQQQ